MAEIKIPMSDIRQIHVGNPEDGEENVKIHLKDRTIRFCTTPVDREMAAAIAQATSGTVLQTREGATKSQPGASQVKAAEMTKLMDTFVKEEGVIAPGREVLLRGLTLVLDDRRGRIFSIDTASIRLEGSENTGRGDGNATGGAEAEFVKKLDERRIKLSADFTCNEKD